MDARRRFQKTRPQLLQPCIPQFGAGHAPSTFLRFDSDIPQREGLGTTSLVQCGDLGHYHLNLEDIRLGGMVDYLVSPKMFLFQVEETVGWS